MHLDPRTAQQKFLPGNHCTFDLMCFFQNQKDCRSPLEVLNGHFDRCVGFSQSTLDTLAASLAGIFCTPTGDETGHPLLWDTYKGESLNGASSNTYIHTTTGSNVIIMYIL